MASIPLPALDVRPPTPQPNPLDQFMRLQQLKALTQNAPLQTQELQNQVQSGQLENQQRQMQVKDQQAMTSAMQQWDGKSIDDLAPLVLKNGGSAQAVMGLKQKSLEMRNTASTIAKNDAEAGSANAATMMKKNDMISGALSTVLQAPDDQLPQALVSTAQGLVQRGLLDPQHAQAAQQLAQSGDPTAIRQQLDTMRKTFMAQSQILDEAQKQTEIAKNKAQTDEATATTQKTQAENAFYAKNGGAPGVPVENQALAAFLQTHPGANASDFIAWKAKQSPMAVVMGNQLGGEQNADALDMAAQNYRLTGQMPPGLSRSPGTTTAIIARAAQLDQQQGGAGIAANKANLGSLTDALKKVQTTASTVGAFEATAEKNMDLLQQTAAKIPDLGARFANVPVRMISSSMIGTDNMASFKAALATAQTEAAKVLNSSNASGVLSDSARHELQGIIDGNMPYSAMVASMNTLKQDMHNRNQAYQQQIEDLQGRIKGAGTSTPNAIQSGAAPKAGAITVTAPNGKTYSFPDQDSADSFKKRAGIK